MHHCSNCGEILNDSMAFCPRCGVAANTNEQKTITCPRCGESLNQDERFCHRCGLFLLENESEDDIEADSDSQVKKGSFLQGLVKAILVLIIIFVCTYAGLYYYDASRGMNDNGAKNYYVTFIRNSTPAIYPNTTYGKALTKFFRDRSWEHHVDDNGRHIVEFHGTCLYDNQPARITLVFVADPDGTDTAFESLYIDDVLQDEFTRFGFLLKVFGD